MIVEPVGLGSNRFFAIDVPLSGKQMEAAIASKQSGIRLCLSHERAFKTLIIREFQRYLYVGENWFCGNVQRRLDSRSAKICAKSQISAGRHLRVCSRHAAEFLRQGTLLLSRKLQLRRMRRGDSLC